MSEHLDKAKAALLAASEMDVELGSATLPHAYKDLLVLARVQAEVAQADALTRIAEQLQRIIVAPNTNRSGGW